ncbi:MAG: NUDIX hydrolase [Parvibaculum sp.]
MNRDDPVSGGSRADDDAQSGDAGVSIAFTHRVPDGDSLPRAVCDTCGFVNYVNPKIVVGSVVTYEDRFLLCRRAIEPRRGFWTLPAGFMEEKETSEAGAAREAMEEANAEIEIRDLLAVYNIPRISQVQLMYRARLLNPNVSAGVESLEVAFFTWDEIPWNELAFPSVYWALNQFRSVMNEERIVPFGNPVSDMGNDLPRRDRGREA